MINTIQTQNPTVLGNNANSSSGYAPVDPTLVPNLNENNEPLKKFSKTPQRQSNKKYLLAGILLLLLTIGGGIGLYLMKLNQDLRQQASEGGYTLVVTQPPGGGGGGGGGGNPTAPPTQAPTTPPTEPPTTTTPTATNTPTPTTEPTTEPTAEPTTAENNDNDGGENNNDGGSSSSSDSSSSSSSNVTVNLSNKTTGTASQPSLPQQLPKTGPEDWLKYLQVGLGALGAGALLLLFL